jgi:beta-aspartyl-peptidase (threonine type)
MLLAIHGGAGNRKPSKRQLDIIRQALQAGFEKMRGGCDALSAVVEAITILEDSSIFNAGAGGVLQLDGTRRLDASIMEGAGLQAGSVIGLEGFRNPIMVARIVLDLPHVMLTNVGARRIARADQLATLGPPSEDEIAQLDRIRASDIEEVKLYRRYFSTVGAVARDAEGNLAAGASTGGIRAMLPGRVGDTPIIGAGTYADNTLGAVSCTGTGEHIVRLGLAKEVCMNIRHESLRRAAKHSLKRIVLMGGTAGVICVAAKGGAVILHTTQYMASGYINKGRTVIRDAFPRARIQE